MLIAHDHAYTHHLSEHKGFALGVLYHIVYINHKDDEHAVAFRPDLAQSPI